MYNLLKYLAGIGFALIGLSIIYGGVSERNLFVSLGGMLIFIAGMALVPPVSESIKEKLSIWRNQITRVVSINVFLLIGFVMAAWFIGENRPFGQNNISKISSRDNGHKEKNEYMPYMEYINKMEQIVLPEDRVKERNKKMSELQNNIVYTELVNNSKLSEEYLPVLTAMANGLGYITQKDFGIDGELMKRLENSTNGKEKTDFVVKTVFLALPSNGGIPKELIEVFERYRQRYKYYGVKGRMYNLSGKEEERITSDYYIAPIFGVLEPNNKNVLDAIYEAKERGMSAWTKNSDYTYPYLSSAEDYIKHIKKVHPGSKALPKRYNASFWKNYDPMVNDRILSMILLGDCKGLQNEFDTAYENIDRQLARTGTGNGELMDFIEGNMRKLNCYK